MKPSWRPRASAEGLRLRARRLAALRAHFAASGCIEVATPVLVATAAAEPALGAFRLATAHGAGPGWLRTSPESAMKRLLAAGSGDIYQLGPVFRADEAGRRHLPEFTLLEWYRVGRDHHALMDDVEALLRALDWHRPITRRAYAELFEQHLGLDPHRTDTALLAARARDAGVPVDAAAATDRALLLDALYAFAVEPALEGACFVFDYPRELRAYARLGAGAPPRAERFELIVDGLELANGYHEVIAVDEQAGLFAAENALRRQRGLPRVEPDPLWLAALADGLPPCAGVALGIERLWMVLEGARDIADVAPFAADYGA